MNKMPDDMRVHVLLPGSVLVLQSKHILDMAALEKVKQQCKDWKEANGVNIPIMFLDASVDISVVEPPPATKSSQSVKEKPQVVSLGLFAGQENNTFRCHWNVACAYPLNQRAGIHRRPQHYS